MSIADKNKLDGIAEGANKTIVDAALSSSSTNPVQNKVINSEITKLNDLIGSTQTAVGQAQSTANEALAKSGVTSVNGESGDVTVVYVQGSLGAKLRTYQSIDGEQRDVGMQSVDEDTSRIAIYHRSSEPIEKHRISYRDASGTSRVAHIYTTANPPADATTSAAGLMSAADKTKLDGVDEGANKTIVDSSLSSTSTNPVQNKVVNAALSEKVSTTRTINGKALSANISLTASDVGAATVGHTHTKAEITDFEDIIITVSDDDNGNVTLFGISSATAYNTKLNSLETEVKALNSVINNNDILVANI